MKTCNTFYNCNYKTFEGTSSNCKYNGYCDYQTPRDRNIEDYCECIDNTIYIDGIGGEKFAIECPKMAGKNQSQIEKLADEIENLCCCGNCKFLVIFHKWKILCLNPESIQNEKEVLVCHYCDKWQLDGMTRSQRGIK